ncbi:hypothetical protein [Cellulophaga tyrosinoxydans]|uniref:hypothetical protein n=1 Tax=Cellulophaga tyrosinoxydans TaxID=504486 RepID=UPI0011777C99|nr:hypothetical protein [Cellulophaga tyrosinoxydans]
MYFTVISLVVTDALTVIEINGTFNYQLQYGTYIIAFLNYISVFIFFRIKTLYGLSDVNKSVVICYNIWLFYLIFSLFRGFYLAEDYWSFKFFSLESVLFTLIALVFYLGQNLTFFWSILQFYLKKILLFGFLLIPLTILTDSELYGRLMLPTVIFIIFIPYLKRKWVILILTVVTAVVLVNSSWRANLIKIAISFLIVSVYFFRRFFNKTIITIIWLSFFITPIIFLYLGLSGNYNLFQEASKNEDYTSKGSTGEEESLSADTRTFLYEEIILDVAINEGIIFGKSPSQGYISNFFYDTGGAVKDLRYKSEVHILNLFLYFGIFGVLLYLILILIVSYLAIFKSNNWLAKMLGLLISSRFMMAFIEESTTYDLNYYFFWLLIGLLSSNQFRILNDKEISVWLLHGPKFLKFKYLQAHIEDK